MEVNPPAPRPMTDPEEPHRNVATPPAWIARGAKGGGVQVDKVVATVTGAKPGAWKNLLAFSVLIAACALLLVAWRFAGPSVSVSGAAANAGDNQATLHKIDKQVGEILIRLAALESLPDRVRALEIRAGGK